MANNSQKRAASSDAVQMASTEIGHKPPQAPEVEEAVIGAMMLDADSVSFPPWQSSSMSVLLSI